MPSLPTIFASKSSKSDSSACPIPMSSGRDLPLFFALLLLLTLASLPTSQGFILQELPLYRNTRDSQPPMALAHSGELAPIPLVPLGDGSAALFFARPARAFNYQRLNRLRDYWNRNEVLRRMAQTWKRQSADELSS